MTVTPPAIALSEGGCTHSSFSLPQVIVRPAEPSDAAGIAHVHIEVGFPFLAGNHIAPAVFSLIDVTSPSRLFVLSAVLVRDLWVRQNSGRGHDFRAEV